MIKGIYVDPAALVNDQDYARKLVDKEVSVFLLRTGFSPVETVPFLDQAVEAAARIGVDYWFLAGTWWGHGIPPAEGMMALPAELAQLQDKGLFGNSRAHEGQWSQWAPGDEADERIERNLVKLCTRYEPGGICLAHARYRHPALISGLFETGGRAQDPPSADDWRRVISRLGELHSGALGRKMRGRVLGEFLDELHGTEIFSRWLTYRCQLVSESIDRFVRAVRGVRPSTLIGINAIGPHAATPSGQDYSQLANTCDFVQPLLGYMEWHVFQCVAAWAQWLKLFASELDPDIAFSIAWGLFGFDVEKHHLPTDARALHGEGGQSVIRTVAALLISKSVQHGAGSKIMPVVRGHQWPSGVAEHLENLAKSAGCSAVFYQGTDSLVDDVHGEGWQ